MKLRVKEIIPWFFLIVPLIMFSIFVLRSIIYSFYFSFTDWSGLTITYNFVGFSNYEKLLSDWIFWTAVKNNLVWSALFVAIPVSLGLCLALALDTKIKGANFFKVIFYFPMIMAFVVTGMIWMWMYEPRSGIINSTLRALGLNFLTYSWVTERKTVLYSLIIAASWQHTGFCMVLYLAGLRNIPVEIMEISRIDGASPWQRFTYVTFPMLRYVTMIVIAMTVINSFKVFDIVYVMTQGGPYRASEVLAHLMYVEGLWKYKMAYGCAIAVILFLIVLVPMTIYLRLMAKGEVAY